MKYYLHIFVSMAIMSIGTVGASESKFTKASDILEYALENHYNIVQSKSQISISEINRDISERWLNPDLDIGVGYDDSEPENRGTQLDLSIMQPIEMPAKRKARKDRARAGYSYAVVSFEGQKELVAVEMLTVLNRLRQINEEKQILAEITSTFTGIIKNYQARPTLSPEDRVSLDLFKFSLNNYQIEVRQLNNEEKSYLNVIKTIYNSNDISLGSKLFLYSPKVWPKIGNIDENVDSIELTKENINIEIAKADYLEAKSSSFSEFRVGPYIQTRPGDMGMVESYGVRFSAPFPLYSSAKPSRAGHMAVRAAERGYEFKKREVTNLFISLKEEYQTGISSLKQYDVKNLQKNHRNIEKLFASGHVTSSVFIEAHRQMLESIRLYNQYELDTLSNLWKLYSIQRKLLTNIQEVYHE